MSSLIPRLSLDPFALKIDDSDERAKAFFQWRFKVLLLALLPFLALAVYQGCVLFGARLNLTEILIRAAGDDYAAHFATLKLYSKIEDGVLFVSISFAWVLTSYAVWRHYRQGYDDTNCRLVCWSALLLIGPPFLTLMFLPFKDAVDYDGFKRQKCLSLVADAHGHIDDSLAASVVNKLAGIHSLDVNSRMCNGDPYEWPQRMHDFLEDKGLIVHDSSCRALMHTGAFPEDMHAFIKENLNSPSCAACKLDKSCYTDCMPLLLPLGFTMAVKGISQVGEEQYAQFGQSASACYTCFHSAASCFKECSGFNEIMDDYHLCLTAPQVEQLKAVLELIAQTPFPMFLVGLVFVARALTIILPIMFAVLTGARRGSECAGEVLPHSKFPGVLSMTLNSVMLPSWCVTLLCLQTLIGTWYTSFACMLLLLDMALRAKYWKRKGMDQIVGAMGKKSIWHSMAFLWTLRLTWVTLFIIAIVTSQFLQSVWEFAKNHVNEEEYVRELLVWETMWRLLRMAFIYFGSAKVTTVFFADTFIHITYAYHRQEAFELQESRDKLRQNVEQLRPLLDSSEDSKTRTVALVAIDTPREASAERRVANSGRLCAFAFCSRG